MTLQTLDSMWSVTKRHAPRFPKSISRLSVAMLFAFVLLQGISTGETMNGPTNVVNAQNQGICDRTLEVQTGIILEIPGNPTCELVTDAQLNDITGRLLLGNDGITSLKVGDFAGLTSIREIHINHNSITELPIGLFDGLSSLEVLRMQSNQLTVLPQGVFSSLADSPNLDTLWLQNNEISTIETGAFEGVTFSTTSTASTQLHLYGNQLVTLQQGAFDGLVNVEWLRLEDNEISSIESGVFDDQTALKLLDLANNQLVTLPSDIFEHTTALHTLELQNNKLRSLDAHVFRTLTVLATLYLDGNELTELPLEIFVNEFPNGVVQHMNELRTLLLQGNRLSSLPDGIFGGPAQSTVLPVLGSLVLDDNELSDLPSDLFPLLRICTLRGFRISGNRFTVAPTKSVDGTTYSLFDAFPSSSCADDGLATLGISDIPLTASDLEKIRDNHPDIENLYMANANAPAAAILDLFVNLPLDSFDVSGSDLSSWTSVEIQAFVTAIQTRKDDIVALFKHLWMANTGINAETALSIMEGLLDGTVHQTIDFSDNDLSGLNESNARTRLAAALAALTRLNHLYLRNTGIDGETALTILENVTILIKYIAFADNDLSGWNSADVADRLVAAFTRIPKVLWRHIDLSNTGINDTAAQSILPNLVREFSFRDLPGTTTELDLSNNKLTTFDPTWLEAWEFLSILDLSNNQISSINPETFAPLATYLETLHLIGNPIDPMPVEQEYYDALPNLKQLTYTVPEPTPTVPEVEEEKLGDNLARVLRIEASISAITIRSGGQVRLDVNIYGRQDILDNSLADRVIINWSDDGAGGSFDGSGRQVIYTAPESPRTRTVYASVDQSQCFGFQSQCSTEFKITVLRSSAAVAPTPVPVNPAGTIPSILTDPDGNQYEVFTPEDGGTFTGDTSSLNAGSGAVPNGEIVGLRIAEGASASNEGKTYQRYTLGGNWYEISAVDASNTSVSSYGLNDAVEVCIPLPNELRSNISGLSIVAINADETLTVLSSRVRISTDAGANVCGGISSVPATVAVGTAGSPAPLPTAVPEEVSDLPDTGGAAPPNDGLIWALIIGLVVLVTSTTAISIRRIRIRSGRTWTR